jgi:hypothetical protein
VGRRIGRKIFENIGGWLMEICFYTRKCIFWRFVVLSKEFPHPSYISVVNEKYDKILNTHV